ncbi:MAG: ABC transporter permease [Rhodospirillales bacterium]|nr:ABC transporter permease [Rhodospirillales bacterium]
MRRLPVSLLVGGTLLLVFVACALVPGWFAPYNPDAFNYTALLARPSGAHLFGTDQFGRDILSRTIWAAAVDLQIAIFAVIFPLLIGSVIGLFVGWYEGWLDIVFGRLVDLVVTFPFLVIVIAIVAILGPGLVNMYIAIATVGWVFYARLMRGEVLVQKHADYVAAARGLGYSTPRILFRHILPNAIRPVLVYSVTDMALEILLGSSLGYLGLGAQPPTAEWGVLIADGKNFFTQAPWTSLFPGIAIVLAGLAFSLTGDGLASLFELRR